MTRALIERRISVLLASRSRGLTRASTVNTIPRVSFDLRAYNRSAWDQQVDRGNRWTQPVAPEVVARARKGELELLLTPTRTVPLDWYPPLAGARVLGLAAAGGQQCPLFAAAGAKVVSFDNSPRQLEQDREVAQREGLELRTVEGDMRDLSAFGDASFDLIFHPVSNCFVPEILPVWREAARVLAPGGVLLAGFANPVIYSFDPDLAAQGTLTCRHPLPYSDLTSLSDEERKRRYLGAGEPLCFGHTLEDQIGGQLGAGLVLTGFFEDKTTAESDEDRAFDHYLSAYIATRAVKPRAGVL